MSAFSRVLVAQAMLFAALGCSSSRTLPGSDDRPQAAPPEPATATAVTQTSGDIPKSELEISVMTDKDSYTAGEEVVLKVSIKNTSDRTITVVHPDYWGVSEIPVTDQGGNLIEPDSFKAERKAIADLMTIPAGEIRTHTFSKLTTWTCCYAYSFQNVLGAGSYQIVVSITNPPVKVDPPQGWNGDWTGTLVSDPVTIEVQ